MKYLNLLIIFLLLLLPFTVSAGTGSVKVIDKNGNDITDDNHEKGDSSKKPHPSDNKETEETQDKSTKSTVSNVDAVSAAVENGGINLGYRIGDELFKGGYKLASAGVDEETVTGSNTLKYSLYSTELDPFEDPSVQSILKKSKMIYYAIAIIFICLAYDAFVAQYTFPTWFSDARESISGEESFFDFKAVVLTWILVLLGPQLEKYYYLGLIYSRNVVVSSMTTNMVETGGTSSESLPTYLIINFGWYINALQKVICEYGVYLHISLIYVTCAITAALSIFFSFKHAFKFAFVVNLYTTVFVIMDLITLFFVCFGINQSITHSNSGFVLAGVFFAVVADFIVVSIPTVWLLLQSSFIRRYVRIEV